MFFNLKIVEAKDLPKMDANGLADPYCKLYLSTNQKDARHTKKLKKTLTPVFNDVFTFNVTNFSPSDYIYIKLKDQDLVNAEDISSINLQIIEYQLGKVYDVWKDMKPFKGVKKGGQIHLIIHISLSGEQPFVDTSAQKAQQSAAPAPPPQSTPTVNIQPGELSESSTQQIQITQQPQTDDSTQQPSKSLERPEKIEEEEEELPEIYDYGYFGKVAVATPSETKKKLDFSKYHVSIVSFNNDRAHIEGRKENIGVELGMQLAAKGMPVKSDIISSSINSITHYFDNLREESKTLLLCIASTATTKKLRLIEKAYNEANFIIPDCDGNAPVNSKILERFNECDEIKNTIDLDEVNKSIGSPFKISNDEDRYIFNYLYAHGLSNVGVKIGGCVFIETPLVETVEKQKQVNAIISLLEALLELPAFN